MSSGVLAKAGRSQPLRMRRKALQPSRMSLRLTWKALLSFAGTCRYRVLAYWRQGDLPTFASASPEMAPRSHQKKTKTRALKNNKKSFFKQMSKSKS